MKKIVLVLLGITCLPFMMTLFEHEAKLTIWPLGGSFEKVKAMPFSLSEFLSGHYQKNLGDFCDSTFGLRALFIRLRNQIHYSFWKKLHAQKVVFGRDSYLFEKDHLAAYLGDDVLSDSIIQNTARDLKWIENKCAEHRIIFLTVLAPSKASFYPDQINQAQLSRSKITNNYWLLKQAFNTVGLNYFDGLARLKQYAANPVPQLKERLEFEKIFEGNKKSFLPNPQKVYPNHVLYPKYGTHWSVFGASLVGRDMIGFLKGTGFPELKTLSIEVGDETLLPRSTDADIFESLNLLVTLPWGHYQYPKITYLTQTNSISPPTLLAIGDSFYQTLVSLGMIDQAFDDPEFWYYAQVSYLKGGNTRQVSSLSYRETILSKKIVILFVSEVNYKWFGYGFIQKAKAALL